MSLTNLVKVEKLLEDFDEVSKTSPGLVPWSCHFGPREAPHLVVTTLIHGDEVGPLPAIVDFIRKLSLLPDAQHKIQVSFAIGNLKAAKEGKRFIQKDLNRIFDVKERPGLLEEEQRSVELQALIQTADLYLDFHQTIQESRIPFYVMANHRESCLWAAALCGIDDLVTQPIEESFSPGSKCSDEFAQERNIPALSIECWKKGFLNEAENLSFSLIQQAFNLLASVSENSSVLAKAAKERRLRVWELFYRHRPKSDSEALNPGFKNFDPIAKGQVLGVLENGSPLKAEEAGVILFPKYAEPGAKNVTMRDSLFVLAREQPSLFPEI